MGSELAGEPGVRNEPRQEFVRHRPSPALRGLVTGIAGYDLSGMPPGTHVGMPSSNLTLILPFDRPITLSGRVRGPGSAVLDAATAFAGLTGGLHDVPVLIHHNGCQAGIHVDLTPAGSRALLGMPASELADRVVGLDDLLRPSFAALSDRLAEMDSWTARFVVLERMFLSRIGPVAGRPEVWEAWRSMRSARGALAIHDVAESVNWSRRQLTQRFTSEVGHPPKVAARLMRFEHAHQLLRNPQARLAEVAARCGYADQAHLSREFSRLAGLSPQRWRLAEVATGIAGPAKPDLDG